MTLSDSQQQSLQPIIQASSALSFVGSLAIIFTYIFVDSFRRPSNRLVFFMSFADLFGSVAMFLAEWPVKGSIQNRTLCVVQGWSITFFLLSAMFWTACLSLQILLAVRKGSKLEKLVSLEKWFHLVSWGIPFILATLMLFISKDVYADATLWCWIGPAYQHYRLWFFYMWLWSIFAWNLGVYFFVGFILMRTQKKLAQFTTKSPSALSNHNSWAPSRAMRIYIRKTSFFIIAFFLNWLWGSINRIQNMVSTEQVYALFILHAIFTPLQGFLNFIAYFLVHYLFRTNGQPNTTATSSGTELSRPEVRTVVPSVSGQTQSKTNGYDFTTPAEMAPNSDSAFYSSNIFSTKFSQQKQNPTFPMYATTTEDLGLPSKFGSPLVSNSTISSNATMIGGIPNQGYNQTNQGYNPMIQGYNQSPMLQRSNSIPTAQFASSYFPGSATPQPNGNMSTTNNLASMMPDLLGGKSPLGNGNGMLTSNVMQQQQQSVKWNSQQSRFESSALDEDLQKIAAGATFSSTIVPETQRATKLSPNPALNIRTDVNHGGF